MENESNIEILNIGSLAHLLEFLAAHMDDEWGNKETVLSFIAQSIKEKANSALTE